MLMNQNDKVKAVRVFAKWQIGVGVFGSLVFVAFFLMLRGGKNADERTWYSFLSLVAAQFPLHLFLGIANLGLSKKARWATVISYAILTPIMIFLAPPLVFMCPYFLLVLPLMFYGIIYFLLPSTRACFS